MIDAQLQISFPKLILPRAERTHDRRATNRLPVERDVHYKVLGGKKTVKHVGSGKSLNMSSGGVLFTTESGLLVGEHIELAVSWPAQLDNRIPLKLVATGVLVRTHETQAACLSRDTSSRRVVSICKKIWRQVELISPPFLARSSLLRRPVSVVAKKRGPFLALSTSFAG